MVVNGQYITVNNNGRRNNIATLAQRQVLLPGCLIYLESLSINLFDSLVRYLVPWVPLAN